MRFFVLDQAYKPVTGQTNKFYVLEEAVEAACKYTRKIGRPLKIWEYCNNVRALFGSVQPDGTLVRPPKEVMAIAASLIDKGHEDLADELLDN